MKLLNYLTVLTACLSGTTVASGDNVVIGVEKPRGGVVYESVPAPTSVTVQVFKDAAPASNHVETGSVEPLYSSTDLGPYYAGNTANSHAPVSSVSYAPSKIASNESLGGTSFNFPESKPAAPSVTNQPVKKVEEAKQNTLYGTTQAYLMVNSPDDRVYVGDDGNVHFHAYSGSLHSNVTALLNATDTVRPIVWQVSEQHIFPSDIWLVGDSVLNILDKLLSSYNEPHPIKAWTWENRIVEVYYDKKDRRD